MDFDKLPRHNNTYGYIDVGMAFSSKRDNVLAWYIKVKTGNFYKPSTDRGALASANLIMYRCVDFYHSKELDVYLRKIIYQRLEPIQNNALDDEKQNAFIVTGSSSHTRAPRLICYCIARKSLTQHMRPQPQRRAGNLHQCVKACAFAGANRHALQYAA